LIGRAQSAAKSRLAQLALTGLPMLALLLGGCRQDMQDQPKLEPFEASSLFANGMASRPIPAGTVARGQLRADSRLYLGQDAAGEPLTELPLPLTRELLLRGRGRFEIYCSVCHDSTGQGRGMIVRRGFKQPPSLHEERLRQMPVGYFYDVISNGFGVMSGYGRQLPVADRWAIVAYLQALQLSQNAVLADLPSHLQQEFQDALAQQAGASEAGDDGHADAAGDHHE